MPRRLRRAVCPISREAIVRTLTLIAALVALLIGTAPARAMSRPDPRLVADILCIHSGYLYKPRRVRGERPGYVLWGHGYWRRAKVAGNGEGGWDATSDQRYGGGLSFTVGTWNSAAGRSHGDVPRVVSTSAIAAQPASVQIIAALIVFAWERSKWSDWPTTAHACGLR